jgi:hypothetical protein
MIECSLSPAYEWNESPMGGNKPTKKKKKKKKQPNKKQNKITALHKGENTKNCIRQQNIPRNLSCSLR